jgi:hypothetical protein
MKIANLMSTAFIFSSAVWLMGTVVLGIHGRLLSDVQTKNEGKWLKVLFVVCGGSLLTLVLSAASWLVAVISITTSRILIAGDADVVITNRLISEIIISGFVAVLIVALLAAVRDFGLRKTRGRTAVDGTPNLRGGYRLLVSHCLRTHHGWMQPHENGNVYVLWGWLSQPSSDVYSWLKVLFIVCAVPLWVWMRLSWPQCAASITVSIAGMLALFMIVVYAPIPLIIWSQPVCLL